MKLVIFKTLALVCLLFTAKANATSISISPIDGKYIGINGLGNTSGPYSGGTLGPFVGIIDHIQRGNPSLNVESRGIYEFDIATLLSTTVNSASFSFLSNDPAIGISGCFDLSGCPAITDLDIFGYVGNGVISQSDVDAGTLLTTIGPLPALGSLITLDVTPFISGLVNDGDLFAGFNLRAASFNGGLRVPDGLLTIDYTATPVPEPSTILLFGFGLVGLIGVRRKGLFN